MLVGTAVRKLDKQQRLLIDVGWRHAMGARENEHTWVYIAPGVTADGSACLDVIPEQVIQKRYAGLEDVPEDDPMRRHIAVVFSSMEHRALDVQGRVSLSSALLTYAGIKGPVKIAGAGDCIQVTPADGGDEAEAVVDFEKYRSSRMALAELRKNAGG
jgi:DNA-binding transcriptional regulator/RsmH inhibitor MraZ